jgi:hypothetical protein
MRNELFETRRDRTVGGPTRDLLSERDETLAGSRSIGAIRTAR